MLNLVEQEKNWENQMKIIIKMVPLLQIVDGVKKLIRTWYQKIFKKAVLNIKLVGGTKIRISRRNLKKC